MLSDLFISVVSGAIDSHSKTAQGDWAQVSPVKEEKPE
jgi:hypothetical protein